MDVALQFLAACMLFVVNQEGDGELGAWNGVVFRTSSPIPILDLMTDDTPFQAASTLFLWSYPCLGQDAVLHSFE